MTDKFKEVEREWGKFTRELLELEKCWKKISELMLEVPSLDTAPIGLQKILSRINTRSRFEDALRDMTRLWQLNGGLESIVYKEESIFEGEED